LKLISEDGPSNFEILTDFDQTLTRYFYFHEQQAAGQKKKKADSSFKAISDSPYIPTEVKELNR
jgi:hypothetical protein